jgi:phosphoglycerol transferase MdoB-like AlkP superfamily enzyme
MEDSNFSEILLAFLLGIRFDLASLAMVMGVFWLLASIQPLNRFRFYVFLWSYLPVLLLAWFVGHMIGDLVYFENANKHIGYEAFVFIGKDLIFIIFSFLQNDPLAFFLALGMALFYLIISWKLYKKKLHLEFYSEPLYRTGLNLVIIILAAGILIRGGLQDVPLRASDSIVSNDQFVNNLALNGVFTSIMDLKSQKIPKNLKMDLGEATVLVRKEIDYAGARWVNHPNYPILRETIPKNSGRAPNIVLILLESWTGKFVQPVSDGMVHGKELTPYFNSLSKQGHAFKRFFATGGRTTNGMLAVLTGIPDRPGLTAVRTHQILSKFGGLGTITKSLGYRTIFVTGDDLSFDNVRSIMPRWGFDIVKGKDYMQSTGKYKIGAWGYDDRDLLEVLEDEMNATPKDQPFLAVALTMSTHYPYKVPDSRFAIFSPDIQDYDYLNTYHYADWALHEFMESFRKSDRFKDTIFVFVGDHTHHRYLNYYEDRNIPFLLYSPGRIPPKVDNRISGQLDIIPTVLGLIGKKTYFSAMGRDLLDPSSKVDSAYFAYGQTFGWIEGDLFFYQFSDGPTSLNFRVDPPHEDSSLCISDPLICETHKAKAKAFFNLGMEILNKDRIFPY